MTTTPAPVETIVAAACRVGHLTTSLPAPKRHGDIMRSIGAVGFNYIVGPDEQGFLTSTGRFVGRFEAADIAIASKQIKQLAHPPQLYSEDLW